MFRVACDTAKEFTFPVVISSRTIDGKITGGIAAFVVLNDEGWIATCWHVAEQLLAGQASEQRAKNIEAQIAAIKNNAAFSFNEKRRKTEAIPKMRNSDISRMSALWVVNLPHNPKIQTFHVAPPIDLAIGKLEPFDPTWVKTYPKFKDPSQGVEPGVSLCRLGYPFHDIAPIWNGARDTFELPAGTFPIPRFAIEGMVTRLVNVEIQNAGPPPFPMALFEMSTPGLRGQSGGPAVDTQGNIWGIQSHTVHYPLGFNPPVPNSNKKQTEYQFLNVGRCVHVASIIGLLQSNRIKFTPCGY
jgi:hypothetical protein